MNSENPIAVPRNRGYICIIQIQRNLGIYFFLGSLAIRCHQSFVSRMKVMQQQGWVWVWVCCFLLGMQGTAMGIDIEAGERRDVSIGGTLQEGDEQADEYSTHSSSTDAGGQYQCFCKEFERQSFCRRLEAEARVEFQWYDRSSLLPGVENCANLSLATPSTCSQGNALHYLLDCGLEQ